LDKNWFQENKPLIIQNIIDISMEHLEFNDIENGKIFGSDFTSAFFVEKNNHSDLFKGTKTQLAQNLADISAKK
jgi:hypothetical protein